MRRRFRLPIAFVTGLVLLAALSEATAEEFPGKDKIVRILVGYPPGGGVDTTARLVARHAVKHLPNNPNVIIQNMPGAGGRIALTYLSQVAKKDGLTWSVVPVTPPLIQILDKDRKFDVTKLIYLGGSAEPGITVIRDFTGVKTPGDLLRVDPKKLAIPGRASPDTSQMLLKTALDLLGVKGGYKTTLGYPGTAKITAAMLQGEASFYSWSLINVLKGGILYDPIREGKVIPLWQTGQMSPDGEVVRDPRIDLPTFAEVHKKLTGKAPSGPAGEAYRFLGPGMRTLNRAVILTPGVQKDRVELLRNSFDNMTNSPEFAGDLKRITGFKWIWFSGKKAEKIRDGLLKGVTPEVLSYMKSLM